MQSACESSSCPRLSSSSSTNSTLNLTLDSRLLCFNRLINLEEFDLPDFHSLDHQSVGRSVDLNQLSTTIEISRPLDVRRENRDAASSRDLKINSWFGGRTVDGRSH